MERRRFSTIMCEGLGAAYDGNTHSPHREIVLECSGLQVPHAHLRMPSVAHTDLSASSTTCLPGSCTSGMSLRTEHW